MDAFSVLLIIGDDYSRFERVGFISLPPRRARCDMRVRPQRSSSSARPIAKGLDRLGFFASRAVNFPENR
uniref:Uncharacterized protein n=1 Tax=Trichogramma kaykai TaxID=54128 RepID=A0ABD2W062_9HYME